MDDRGKSYEGVSPASPPNLHATVRRVALIIGNGKYEHAASLPNPERDADALAATFKSLGFDVVLKELELNFKRLHRTLTDFRLVAEGADTAVVYFAGHGIEIDGSNRLIPVDAQLDHVVHIAAETVPLASVQHAVRGANRLRVVILDACRDNPFLQRMRGLERGRDVGGWSRVTIETEPSRSIGQGLAAPTDLADAMLIAYAADAGQKAKDGPPNGNSPFASALVDAIKAEPAADVRQLFGRVGETVAQVTKGLQQPARYDKLGGGHYSFGLQPKQSAGVDAQLNKPTIDERAIEHTYWQSISSSATLWDFEEFLLRFNDGVFSTLAHQRAKSIIADATDQSLLQSVLQRYPASKRAPAIRKRLAAIGWAELNANADPSERQIEEFILRFGETVEAVEAKARLAKIGQKAVGGRAKKTPLSVFQKSVNSLPPEPAERSRPENNLVPNEPLDTSNQQEPRWPITSKRFAVSFLFASLAGCLGLMILFATLGWRFSVLETGWSGLLVAACLIVPSAAWLFYRAHASQTQRSVYWLSGALIGSFAMGPMFALFGVKPADKVFTDTHLVAIGLLCGTIVACCSAIAIVLRERSKGMALANYWLGCAIIIWFPIPGISGWFGWDASHATFWCGLLLALTILCATLLPFWQRSSGFELWVYNGAGVSAVVAILLIYALNSDGAAVAFGVPIGAAAYLFSVRKWLLWSRP